MIIQPMEYYRTQMFKKLLMVPAILAISLQTIIWVGAAEIFVVSHSGSVSLWDVLGLFIVIRYSFMLAQFSGTMLRRFLIQKRISHYFKGLNLGSWEKLQDWMNNANNIEIENYLKEQL